jgi:hypothetical protein
LDCRRIGIDLGSKIHDCLILCNDIMSTAGTCFKLRSRLLGAKKLSNFAGLCCCIVSMFHREDRARLRWPTYALPEGASLNLAGTLQLVYNYPPVVCEGIGFGRLLDLSLLRVALTGSGIYTVCENQYSKL